MLFLFLSLSFSLCSVPVATNANKAVVALTMNYQSETQNKKERNGVETIGRYCSYTAKNNTHYSNKLIDQAQRPDSIRLSVAFLEKPERPIWKEKDTHACSVMRMNAGRHDGYADMAWRRPDCSSQDTIYSTVRKKKRTCR